MAENGEGGLPLLLPAAAAAAAPTQRQQPPQQHAQPLPAPTDDAGNDDDFVELTVHHRGTPHVFRLPRRSPTSPLAELSTRIAATLGVAAMHQKLLVTPHVGLLKGPFGAADQDQGSDNHGYNAKDDASGDHENRAESKEKHGAGQQQQQQPTLTLDALRGKKIVLMGPTASELASVESKPHSGSLGPSRRSPYAVSAASAASARQRPRNNFSADADASYTFTTLRPLPHLPHADRALAYLERLRADPGVRAVMRARRWRVPLLTEMDPGQHTSRDAAGGVTRILGLNRNRGEAIELRLRTDAYDGWRAYASVRATLCHELAHNEHGEHDARFWRLCREIERDVQRADWRGGGGRALTDEVFYDPEAAAAAAAAAGHGEEGEVHDHGGWIGGEYVLGGGNSDGSGGNGGSGSGDGPAAPPALSRREILARAAEERMKQQQQRK